MVAWFTSSDTDGLIMSKAFMKCSRLTQSDDDIDGCCEGSSNAFDDDGDGGGGNGVITVVAMESLSANRDACRTSPFRSAPV